MQLEEIMVSEITHFKKTNTMYHVFSQIYSDEMVFGT